MTKNARPRLSSRRGGAIVAGLVVGIGLVVLVASHRDASSRSRVAPSGLAGANLPPLPGGLQETLSAARSNTTVPLYLPEGTLAGDGSIKVLWVRGAPLTAVWVQYGSGVVVQLQPAANLYATTPEAYFRNQIAGGTPGTVGQINGMPSFMTPPDKQGDTGTVEMAINGVDVQVVGDGGETADQLNQIAASIPLKPQSISSGTPSPSTMPPG